ncbi:MAG: acetate kinase [Acidobacteria bacterium]|nr:acetate kinase [Acidobacteriota bacterium]MCW5970885.1 acetate kinase [Blastocatellales bacterium]
MNVLVLNCGSSTIKFQVIATDLEKISANADERLARGAIERIGGEAVITRETGASAKPQKIAAQLRDARAAVDFILRWLCAPETGILQIASLADLHAVGHRVVHGGERFTHSVLIDDEVLHGIEDCIDLAPLHNPANIRGIRTARELLGAGVPQVAVFDTAFHQTLPDYAYLYALPYQFYRRHRIRRYGFHGTSHRYVAYRYRQMLGIAREATKVITLHLGNGCSAAAICEGNSVDTSMGMTPLEGLVMGTRSGDLDPAIIDFLSEKEGLSAREVESMLNKQSGLIGISGLTNDMRELMAEAEENQDRRARLAIDIFCYRARKYIGGYLSAMGGADAVIFTGGIGENAAEVRAKICRGLEWCGLSLDDEINREMIGRREGRISTEDSRLAAYVIPTDEELLIARDTVRCVEGVKQRY